MKNKIITTLGGIFLITIIFLGVFYIKTFNNNEIDLSQIKSCDECKKLGADYECNYRGSDFVSCDPIECWHHKDQTKCITKNHCIWYEEYNLCCGKDEYVKGCKLGPCCCPKGALCD